MAGNLTYLTGNFSVSNSNIGPVDVSLLMTLLNQLFDKGIVPMVNIVLKQGFVLPTVKGKIVHNICCVLNSVQV